MNRVFQPRGYFTVPDGTAVSAFLNATDATQDDVPWGAAVTSVASASRPAGSAPGCTRRCTSTRR
jgi:hypothetical protein